MSQKGSILRGKKWYTALKNREIDGSLKKVISDDAGKMVDVNNYLKSIEKVEEKKEETKSKGKK